MQNLARTPSGPTGPTLGRDGTTQDVNVTALVPGDVVHLSLGAIIPGDIRLLSTKNLLCDESILTGEPLPACRDPAPVAPGSALGDLASCVFMGTVIQSGGYHDP
ncbi:P-type ATPase [Arthrobacter sp. MMS24-S77]